MKIIVSNIPPEGMDLQFVKNGQWLSSALSQETEPVTCSQDVQVTVHARRIGENVFLEGSITTGLDLVCCRCLEPAALPVAASFKYTLSPTPEGSSEEIELTSEDLEYGYYDEDTVDLEPLVFEQILLQIPIRVLCREDCRGLCPPLRRQSQRGTLRVPRESC